MGRKTNRQRKAAQTASAREKAAAARAIQKRQEQRRRAAAILGGVVVIAVVGALIAVLVIVKVHNDSKGNRKALPAAVLTSVTNVSDASLNAVGKGNTLTAPSKVSGQPPLTSGGKPELLYVGAEFCPYCAAERWSLAIALSKFGTLGHMSQVSSSKVDVDPDTSSLDFYHSTYSSQYLTFTPVENEDRNRKTLEKLTTAQSNLISTLEKGDIGFPTISFGNKLAYDGNAPLDPSTLKGLSQQQIADQLNNPKSKVAQVLDGGANDDIAAICSMTNNQPSSVCSSTVIQGLEKQFNA